FTLALLAFSFFAFAIVRKYGCSSGGISRRSDARERWGVVFNGASTAPFPVVARQPFFALAAGNLAIRAAGLLGGTGNADLFLGTLSGASGFSRNNAAGSIDHSGDRGSDMSSLDCFARAPSGGFAACKSEERIPA